MSFQKSFCILAVLANSPVGATAGNIAKRVGGYGCTLTRRQVEHALKELVADGWAISELVKYRGDLTQRLYHMTSEAAQSLEAVAGEFAKMTKQQTLPGIERPKRR